MIAAIPTETHPGEKRVALSPAAAAQLIKAGLTVRLQRGAGSAAGHTDQQYADKGVELVDDRDALFAEADIIAQVRTPGAAPEAGGQDMQRYRQGQLVVGHAEPLTAHEQTKAMAQRGATLAAMELIPRITRAQAMDALSSQANLGGYKAVLLAANLSPKIFPMMMTAAGTLKPAKVFVIGAGVAGLQAIATAKRLGATVSATDVRPATKEQVESLGGKFVMVEEAMAEGEGGYAKELTAEQKQKQQELVESVVAESDVVITTAAIPGRKAPVLVTEAMVAKMQPRSIIVDMAAERGGNCELTEEGQIVEKHGVTIVGSANLPGELAHDASAMYANNVVKLLNEMLDDGRLKLDMDNEVIAGVVVCKDGEVVHPRVREAMGMGPLAKPEAQAAPEAGGERDAADGTKPQAGEEDSSNEGSAQ